MPTVTVLRAHRYTLDPTQAQGEDLGRYAGANRWAYNFAIAHITGAHKAWSERRDTLTAGGLSEAEAKARIKLDGQDLATRVKALDERRKACREAIKLAGPRHHSVPALREHLDQVRTELRTLQAERFTAGYAIPSAIDLANLWRSARDLPKEEGGCPWWGEVNTYCFTSGFDNAATAWKNFISSRTGARKGAAVGYPRFKSKGRARDSFALFHDTKNPGIRLEGHRRILLPKLGSVRMHSSGRHLARAVSRGDALIKSVTVSRAGARWYVSVLAEEKLTIRDAPTSRQRVGGVVGVDLGSTYLAVLSQRSDPGDPLSDRIESPKRLQAAQQRLKRAQQALSRTEKGSVGRMKAARRVGELHRRVAEQRAGDIHQLTKRLAAGFTHVVVEGMDVKGLTASAKGSVELPGKRVRLKAKFNRHLLDAAPGMVRQQLGYKTGWYGSTLVTLDKGAPTNRTCSKCGAQNPHATPPGTQKFTCNACGFVEDRHTNSARVIARLGRHHISNAAADTGEA